MKLENIKLGDRVRFRFGFSDGPMAEATVIKISPEDVNQLYPVGHPWHTPDTVYIKVDDDPACPACTVSKSVEDVELVGK